MNDTGLKVLVTGANGTVGSPLVRHLRQLGHHVTTWDRSKVPVDDYNAMEAFVREIAPDVLFHLAIYASDTGKSDESWLVNYEWPSELAWICRIHNIKFIFTSTAMVFSNDASGPFSIDSTPDAQQGYGYEKRCAEERVFYQKPNATVVRLGWQIGTEPGNNNMLDFMEQHMREHGQVSASSQWLPACSFLSDTIAALTDLIYKPHGLYMFDSNSQWSFYDICCALSELHGGRWKVVPNNDFVYDQRMQDKNISLPDLDTHLAALHR